MKLVKSKIQSSDADFEGWISAPPFNRGPYTINNFTPTTVPFPTEPKRAPITPFINGTVRMPSWDLLRAPIEQVSAKGFKS